MKNRFTVKFEVFTSNEGITEDIIREQVETAIDLMLHNDIEIAPVSVIHEVD